MPHRCLESLSTGQVLSDVEHLAVLLTKLNSKITRAIVYI